MFSYITALRRSEILQLVKDEKNPMQPELFDHQNLVEFEHDGVRYVLCHNPFRKNEDARTRERLLCLIEEKLAMISKSVANGRLKRMEPISGRFFRWVNHWGMDRL